MITTSVRLSHFKKILLTESGVRQSGQSGQIFDRFCGGDKLIKYFANKFKSYFLLTYPMQNSFSDKIKSLLIKVLYLDFVKKVTDAIVTRGVL